MKKAINEQKNFQNNLKNNRKLKRGRTREISKIMTYSLQQQKIDKIDNDMMKEFNELFTMNKTYGEFLTSFKKSIESKEILSPKSDISELRKH